jgi:hypothetical protein
LLIYKRYHYIKECQTPTNGFLIHHSKKEINGAMLLPKTSRVYLLAISYIIIKKRTTFSYLMSKKDKIEYDIKLVGAES